MLQPIQSAAIYILQLAGEISPLPYGNRILNANRKAGKKKRTLTIISMVEVGILAKIENFSLNEHKTKPNNTLVSKLNPQIVSAM